MEILRVYNQADLNKVNLDGVVSYDVYVYGGEIISLRFIKHIEGYLGFANVDNINLCNIEVIDGDLWVSTSSSIPDSINLGRLKRINGNLNLRNTPLKSLEELEYIGGDANLRDTEINDLGKVKFIGGNLTLPKALKGKVDLTNVEIGGTIKYYKPRTAELRREEKGLTQADRKIPPINQKNSEGIAENYITSPSQATEEQVGFYNYFKRCFYSGIVIDVKGFLEYPSFLIQSMVEDLSKPLNIWLKDYDRLIWAYPELDNEAPYYFRRNSTRYDIGWEVSKRKRFVDISDIGYYEEKLNKRLFTIDSIIKWESVLKLSPWGKQHIEEIKPFIQSQLENFESIWGRRFLQVFVDATLNPSKEYTFYKQFYSSREEFDHFNSIEYGKFLPENFSRGLPLIVEHAIKSQCGIFSTKAEELYRESIGMPQIGEYWRSETELYYSIKEAFKGTEVKQHFSPIWLDRQHLDVYLPEYNIGVEYQGIQHYKPIDFFGGEDAFLKVQERDARKKRLCEENGCFLLYVNEGYSLNEVIEQISQKIGPDILKATNPKLPPIPPKVVPPNLVHHTDNCQIVTKNEVKNKKSIISQTEHILKQLFYDIIDWFKKIY